MTPELVKALDKGYVVLDIFEVYHYPQTSENTVDPFSGEPVNLFGDFVDMFYKIKTESSGFPSGCLSQEDKDKYVADFEAKEGILLDTHMISKNPCRRQVAKSILCALYGKLGQSENKTSSQIISSHHVSDLYKIICDPTKILSDFHVLSEKTLIIEYSPREGSIHSGSSTNVMVAAFIAAYGRLDEYELADACGQRLLYCDTDSVIYLAANPSHLLSTGPYLGQLTSELPPDTYIVTFLSTGPKSYGYILSNGENVMKCKGFSLNIGALEVMNMESMRLMLCAYSKKVSLEVGGDWDMQWEEDVGYTVKISVKNARIFAVKRSLTLNTQTQFKTYAVTSSKRLFSPDLTSVPFGF